MKNLLLIISILILSNGYSQKENKNTEIKIVTSAECGTCKKTLEEKLTYSKGIRYAELDVTTKIMTVGYSSKKTTPDKIRSIISETGYDADNVSANPSTQQSLPSCCQPGGMNK